MALDFIPRLAARLVKQSAVPTGCRAADQKERPPKKTLLMGEEQGKKREKKYFLPDVEVKGDVRFNLQLVFLCWLKYAVLVAFLVFQDLAVEKPERRG